jgi:hypothetical protein
MKIKIIAGIVAGLVLVGGGLSIISTIMAKNTPTSSSLVIEQKDFNKREQEESQAGTITKTKNPTPEKEVKTIEETAPVTTEETTDTSPLDGIKQAFATKYNKNLADIDVTITQSDDTHAKGAVNFGGGEGGMFLATKIDNIWTLVFDGNGSIACADLAPYSFPQEMIAELCY